MQIEGGNPPSINFYLFMEGFKNQMSKYKLIQLTNENIGAVAAGNYLPLGKITRRVNAPTGDTPTFQVATSGANIVYINDPGFYKVTYTGTFTAAAAGDLAISLVANSDNVYTISETVAAAEDVLNMTLIYTIRVCPNTCSTPYNSPVSIELLLGDVALGITPAPSTSNLIIERVF
jgi:hypothetical protein